MPTMEAMERRIRSAEDLQGVVRTMKTLAAVSIRQYEEAVSALTDYERTLSLAFRMLRWLNPGEHLQAAAADGHSGAIVFGSDQGMCGPFNEQISIFAHEQMDQHQSDPSRQFFLVIGARAAGRIEDAGRKVDETFQIPGSVSGINDLVLDLLPRLESWRSERSLGSIYLFHNARQSETRWQPQQIRLLPVEREELTGPRPKKWQSRSLPMITLDRSRMLSSLVRQHLFVALFRACAHSLAGENASRITSMQAAEKNIGERLDEFRMQHRQLRQTAITEELLDVVTGFQALKKKRD